MQTKFSGNIEAIRAVEDCIRATKKYTEGISTIRKQHPIQGEDFPSKTFCKYYEVYPEMEISWNMPANVAMDWLWADTPCIDVVFYYDYRSNAAHATVKNGNGALRKLTEYIPGFGEALRKTAEGKLNGQPSHIHVQRTSQQGS